MKFFGRDLVTKLRGSIAFTGVFLAAGAMVNTSAQTAPYVLPYSSMTTIAGPVASLTIGTACGLSPNGQIAYYALDTVGDGCLAPYVSVGSDPHDIRVDAKGNVYWIDNSGTELIHKINFETGVETVYAGSIAQTKSCTSNQVDKYGDGCTASDGAANQNKPTSTLGTSSLAKSRGLGIAPNGDLYIADYGGNLVHVISATTGVMSVIAGTYTSGMGGTSGFQNGTPGTGTGHGEVASPRGVGIDFANSIVYIADTGNDVIRSVPVTESASGPVAGSMSNYSSAFAAAGAGSAACTTTYPRTAANLSGNNGVIEYGTAVTGESSGPVAVGSAQFCAPEDVQVDPYSNVIIADAGNNMIRAVYGGSTAPGNTFFGITNPVAGYVYWIAGFNAIAGGTAITAATAYPTGGATPTVQAQTLSMGIRKIALDNFGNLYIADATNNVTWFVDHVTGYARLIAGTAGAAAGAPPLCATTTPSTINTGGKTDAVGDGCPGPYASIYTSTDADAANAPDNQGNLYLNDAESTTSAGSPSTARLRKLLSGLNFPSVTLGTTSTPIVPWKQTVLIHFGVGDSQAAVNPFVSSNPDFAVGTPTCGPANADLTYDCYLPVTFTPTKAGYDTSTLTIMSTLGGTNSYLLTGTGIAPVVTIDPGNTALLTSTTTNNAQGIVVDAAGNAYIADTGDNQVLKYTAATQTTTVFVPASAGLKSPKAVTMDTTGNVYVADSGNNLIRKMTPAGVMTTYAGGGTVCSQAVDTMGDGCPATSATLSNPSGLAADKLGQIYISDTGNNLIRQINVVGNISVLAGGGTTSTLCANYTDGTGDGCNGNQAIFSGPTGLSYDETGNYLVVADSGDNRVRKIYLGTNWTISGTGTGALATNITTNEPTLVAGNGSTGGVTSSSNSAQLSSLTGPTGVAVDPAENVYIADTGDNVVWMVPLTGTLVQMVGIDNQTGGDSAVPGTATTTQMTSPGAVAVLPTGTLYVADSGNNRILTDTRNQITYNFGRTNQGTTNGPVQFTETNIGTATANLTGASGGNLYTASGSALFTLTASSNSPACTTTSGSQITLAVDAFCLLQGTFAVGATTPVGAYSATYSEGSVTNVAPTPTITLQGTAAVLTPTNSTVAQTYPTTGNAQFGGVLILTTTVKPTSCNNAAPSCVPTGSVIFTVTNQATNSVTTSSPDPLNATTGMASQQYGGTASGALPGLSVGTYTVTCQYSGDGFYASSYCPATTITVTAAGTTSLLSANNNNMPQYTTVTLMATVLSNTTGTPQGSVIFYANGVALNGPAATNPYASTAAAPLTNGVATLTLSESVDSNGQITSNTTLTPGTYSLACTYSGSSNFSGSNCAAVSFTVVPSTPSFTLSATGCPAADLYITGTATPGKSVACGGAHANVNGNVAIATAQGSTTDATIFITPTDTVSGTLTFSCSGLPAASTCTFSPTSIPLTSSSGFLVPSYPGVYTDVTMWTDIQPAQATAELRAPSIGSGRHGMALAMILGWPLTLLGLFGLTRRRKSGSMSGIALVAALMVMGGASLLFSGCAGPGAYVPALTPAGTYPVTVTVTGGGITQSIVIEFIVSAPGIPGQE